MNEWAVWPIFMAQLAAFSLFLFPKHYRLFGLRYRAWVIILLLIINVAIVVSLFHDSTDRLHLHF